MRRRAYLLTAGATLTAGCVGGEENGGARPDTARTPSRQPHLRVVNDSDGEQTFTVEIDRDEEVIFQEQFTLTPRARTERETVFESAGDYGVHAFVEGNEFVRESTGIRVGTLDTWEHHYTLVVRLEREEGARSFSIGLASVE
jgi:hypothetical protein